MSNDVDQLLNHSATSESEEKFQEHGVKRNLSGWWLKALIASAILFSTYQLIVAAFHPLSTLPTRSFHVGFLLLITFLLYPAGKSAKFMQRPPFVDVCIAAGCFILSFYHWIFEGDLIQRSGDPSTMDIAVGVFIVMALFEAVRRTMGLPLVIVCAIFLAYGLLGQYLPRVIAHRGFDFSQIINQLYLGTEGIYGIPTFVSATYIFLFILFGSFLEHAGMIRLFNAFSLGLVGHAQGGPAKVSVISSGLMGTISGSGVANVLTVGQFTIPLMKKYGYKSVFAGAVEATASMGGQIMPPVMGAVAFIMAETLKVPYADIVKAAVIPAMLYYFTAFMMVHFEAGRLQLKGLPKDQCPNPWKSLKESWYLVLPLVVLVYMLFNGFTPMFAGLMGLSLTAIMILGTALASRISATAFRYFFWITLGLGAASFFKFGIVPIIGLISLLVLFCFLVQGGKSTLAILRNSLIDGAKQAVPVGLACAIVGVVVGTLTLTGAASNFAGYILEIGEKNLFLSLVLTMVVCLILGMGIPTIPNYIITSAIAAPALLKLGVPLIVSHMYVFYFGIMADLTPPVALAAFAAASISKTSPMKTGFKAIQIAIAGFVIPYMAVYEPMLMLQGNPTIVGVSYIVFKAVLAIVLWSTCSVGYGKIALTTWERIAAFIAAAALVVANPLSDYVGLGLSALLISWHFWKANNVKKMTI